MADAAQLQILFYDYVPDIAERRGPFRQAHIAYLGRWRDEGRLVMAGALGDPPRGAAIVLRAGSPSDAEEIVRDDPYMLNGLITDWRVEPWMVVVR